jgi:hypothetical protein
VAPAQVTTVGPMAAPTVARTRPVTAVLTVGPTVGPTVVLTAALMVEPTAAREHRPHRP